MTSWTPARSIPSSLLLDDVVNGPYTAGSKKDKGLQKTNYACKQKICAEGFKSPETRQVQVRLVSTLEHMQVPKWDRTRCPEESASPIGMHTRCIYSVETCSIR